MTRFFNSMVLSGMMLGFCGSANAANPLLDRHPFFLHQVSTLEAAGYHSVRDTGDARDRVTAIDADGNEVLVTFNPDQGTVLRIVNIHMHDN